MQHHSIKPIFLGNPILREASDHLTIDEIFSQDIQTLITQMQSMVIDRSLSGLSAVQIGRALRIVVLKANTISHDKDNLLTLINPQFKPSNNDKTYHWESNISLPNLSGRVERYRQIEINFLDQSAKPSHITLSEQYAFHAQHFIDLLSGIIYIDKLTSIKDFGYFPSTING